MFKHRSRECFWAAARPALGVHRPAQQAQRAQKAQRVVTDDSYTARRPARATSSSSKERTSAPM
jgi:hypothetical protein